MANSPKTRFKDKHRVIKNEKEQYMRQHTLLNARVNKTSLTAQELEKSISRTKEALSIKRNTEIERINILCLKGQFQNVFNLPLIHVLSALFGQTTALNLNIKFSQSNNHNMVNAFMF